jgi:hypothetical protein
MARIQPTAKVEASRETATLLLPLWKDSCLFWRKRNESRRHFTSKISRLLPRHGVRLKQRIDRGQALLGWRTFERKRPPDKVHGSLTGEAFHDNRGEDCSAVKLNSARAKIDRQVLPRGYWGCTPS